MARPLVSIVIATYRSRLEHLSVAIASALAQTWREIEVIVSDDSPDSALAPVVAGFADGRLRYRRNEPALGVAANHDAAFAVATGQYLVVLNHDDALAAGFVAAMVAALAAEPAAVLAFCDHWIIDEAGQRLEAETDRNSRHWGRADLAPGLHRPFVQLVAAQSVPLAMGTMFRHVELPGGWATDAGPAYDLWLCYLLGRGGRGAVYVPQRLSSWRTHAANLTSHGGLDWLRGSATCWQAMAADPDYAPVRATARQRAAAAWQACAVRAWREGRARDCARFGARSLRQKVTRRGLAAVALACWPLAWRDAIRMQASPR